MFTYISSWFYNPAQDLPEPSEEQKQNRYKLLKEIQTFDNSNLSPIPETIENFIQQPKKKIFTFKRKRKRKRKKSNN